MTRSRLVALVVAVAGVAATLTVTPMVRSQADAQEAPPPPPSG